MLRRCLKICLKDTVVSRGRAEALAVEQVGPVLQLHVGGGALGHVPEQQQNLRTSCRDHDYGIVSLKGCRRIALLAVEVFVREHPVVVGSPERAAEVGEEEERKKERL